MMGELSAARQALESAGLVPGDRTTLNSLRNPERRLLRFETLCLLNT